MASGQFMLVLHGHLPYVPAPKSGEILEERWLYEAITESYLPLLEQLRQLDHENVPWHLTFSLSAPLMAMLDDPRLRSRYRAHLAKLQALAVREVDRLARDHDYLPVAELYQERLVRLGALYDSLDQDLVGAFAALAQKGRLELITAAGTHGFLPLMRRPESVRAQLEAALTHFERRTGRLSRGIWLPECAYKPGLDLQLSAAGVQYFFTEAHTVQNARPISPFVPHLPVQTPGGVLAFGRDPAVARQVWSSHGGYPGDFDYREFYRDIGWDLPLSEIGPWLVDGSVRGDTGLKYHRITGRGEITKRPYVPHWAQGKAAQHGAHFARLLTERAKSVLASWPASASMPPGGPLLVAPFDAELFGHWWFEGPDFLGHLYRAIWQQGGVTTTTPSRYLDRASLTTPPVKLPESTWGRSGYHEVWLSAANDQLYHDLHTAEERMVQSAATRAHGQLPAAADPYLNQAARELQLAQSSDWAFILDGGTTVQYALARHQEHVQACNALLDAAARHASDAPVPAADASLLHERAERNPLFPHLTWKAYAPAGSLGPQTVNQALLLSWEFPPGNVGGLGRAVHDLGKALCAQGVQVTVLTVADQTNAPGISQVSGMDVLRIKTPQQGNDFLVWVAQLNLALARAGLTWGEAHGAPQYPPVQVIHAHDWLVAQAARTLAAAWRVPLAATIHATEKGRNHGIHHDLQQMIHLEEFHLTAAAQQVITVSKAMGREVAASFRVPPERLHVLYNGIDLPPGLDDPTSAATQALLAGVTPAVTAAEPVLFYIGRLVPEKGIQFAIQAVADLRRRGRRVRLIVAGRGPMETELRRTAEAEDVVNQVDFVGFVTDEQKADYLRRAAAVLVPSTYEPFGIVALEGLAAGRPTVVSDTGGLAEIISHEVDGLKALPGSSPSLADQVERILRDPDFASRLAAAGLARVRQDFTWAAIATGTREVYRQAAQNT